MPIGCPCFNRRSTTSAFTLIEIVLSLGIIAFALVGIMGMLPIAVNTARDSANESQATLIAQRVFAELRTTRNGEAVLTTKDTTANPSISDGIGVDLTSSTAQTVYIAFGELSSAQPYTPSQIEALGDITPAQYDSGLAGTPAMADAQFIVRIDVIPQPTTSPMRNPTRVIVTIESPALATGDIRKSSGRYPFASLISP